MASPSTVSSSGEASARTGDLAEKLSVLREVALAAGVDTLLLREPATLGWLTGARWHVPQTLDSACFDVVVEQAGTEPSLRVVANAIEAPRLADTELADLPVNWSVVPWWEPRSAQFPSGSDEKRVGADRPLPGAVDVAAALAAARRVLTGCQRAQLRAVCADAAQAATAACEQVGPSSTEWELAAAMSAQLLERGCDVVCLFVAGEERIGPHRHPLPTWGRLGRRAMVVACARRHGLVASVTRLVSFGPVPAAENERYRALLDVEAAFLAATCPGTTLGEVLAAGSEAYAQHGFASDEWHRHHQGGLSGFVPRDVLATPGSDVVVPEHAVAAWNPSGDGWKVEDTCLVTATGVEPLVHDPAWPALDVAGRRRPDVLVR